MSHLVGAPSGSGLPGKGCNCQFGYGVGPAKPWPKHVQDAPPSGGNGAPERTPRVVKQPPNYESSPAKSSNPGTGNFSPEIPKRVTQGVESREAWINMPYASAAHKDEGVAQEPSATLEP